MTASELDPAALLIVGAGVAGCALTARLRQLGWGGAITLVEAGRGAGGRAASRRSRQDPDWSLDHGAPFLDLTAADPPQLLAPLLASGCLQPWPPRREGSGGEGRGLKELQEDGTLLEEPGPFAAGELYRGHPAMADLAEGMLHLAAAAGEPGAAAAGAPSPRRIHGQRVDALERRDGQWWLRNTTGETLARGAWLVLSGTLLAHPRCMALLGWSEVPLLAASRRLADPALERALERIAGLGVDPRLALLVRLEADQAGPWRALPFRHLGFSEGARRRWGLERISLQPMADGRCGVVAHARPEDLRQAGLLRPVLGVEGRAGTLQAGNGIEARGIKGQAKEGTETDAAEIEALRSGLMRSLAGWLSPSDLPASATLQRMHWGGAFPLAPGLDPEAMLCPASQLALCGDAISGPGFGRVEGAWRSGEWLAQRLLPLLGS